MPRNRSPTARCRTRRSRSCAASTAASAAAPSPHEVDESVHGARRPRRRLHPARAPVRARSPPYAAGHPLGVPHAVYNLEPLPAAGRARASRTARASPRCGRCAATDADRPARTPARRQPRRDVHAARRRRPRDRRRHRRPSRDRARDAGLPPRRPGLQPRRRDDPAAWPSAARVDPAWALRPAPDSTRRVVRSTRKTNDASRRYGRRSSPAASTASTTVAGTQPPALRDRLGLQPRLVINADAVGASCWSRRSFWTARCRCCSMPAIVERRVRSSAPSAAGCSLAGDRDAGPARARRV